MWNKLSCTLLTASLKVAYVITSVALLGIMKSKCVKITLITYVICGMPFLAVEWWQILLRFSSLASKRSSGELSET